MLSFLPQLYHLLPFTPTVQIFVDLDLLPPPSFLSINSILVSELHSPPFTLPQPFSPGVDPPSTMNGHASNYPPSPYGPGPISPYHEEEETYELTPPQNYRNPNSFDFQFQDSAPSPRPIMPIRPGHATNTTTSATTSTNYSPPEYSSPWLQPTPRFSGGPDSFPNSPYDSRSASPTLVCVAHSCHSFVLLLSFSFDFYFPYGLRYLQCRARKIEIPPRQSGPK